MAEILSFADALRERSSTSEADTDGTGFVSCLLQGEGSREDYIALVSQYYFIYEALESAAKGMRQDPIAAIFVSDKLTRLPALEADLEFLIGPQWRTTIAPLTSTRRYVDRIREVGATWAGGFVAHHYTRYLGDLSGGLFIGRIMKRRFGFDTNGIGFYLFDAIADPRAFKDVYREQLNAAPWDDAERERVIDEVLLAYRFNTELFEELHRARIAA